MHENPGKDQIDQDLALFQERLGLPFLNPRNTTVLILAPFTPTISPYWMFFLAPESKIKDPKIHGKVNEITQFITRCQTFRSIEDQCPVFGEVTIRTQQLKLL